MSSIDSLFNYTFQIKARGTSGTDEENHPITTGWTTVATTPGAVQQRSAREAASLVSAGAVASTHRLYCGFGQPVDEAKLIHVVELNRDFDVVAVRDGGGRGDHLEIDAVAFSPSDR